MSPTARASSISATAAVRCSGPPCLPNGPPAGTRRGGRVGARGSQETHCQPPSLDTQNKTGIRTNRELLIGLSTAAPTGGCDRWFVWLGNHWLLRRWPALSG